MVIDGQTFDSGIPRIDYPSILKAHSGYCTIKRTSFAAMQILNFEKKNYDTPLRDITKYFTRIVAYSTTAKEVRHGRYMHGTTVNFSLLQCETCTLPPTTDAYNRGSSSYASLTGVQLTRVVSPVNKRAPSNGGAFAKGESSTEKISRATDERAGTEAHVKSQSSDEQRTRRRTDSLRWDLAILWASAALCGVARTSSYAYIQHRGGGNPDDADSSVAAHLRALLTYCLFSWYLETVSPPEFALYFNIAMHWIKWFITKVKSVKPISSVLCALYVAYNGFSRESSFATAVKFFSMIVYRQALSKDIM
ncbi:hypothetical protein G5I_11297 [Acromyrmex echinatior]|uniref:Uncharacterized protein n=1 Tax=Acromyrmex echinatior TaxID=103372 RepID=F4WZ83_ACREC|nr:hypothetical protein G5I_11297 [Acromyrmex echinatior]